MSISKRGKFKLFLLIVMLALSLTALTACGLFGSRKVVKQVNIVIPDSLTRSAEGDYYVARLGESLNLSLDWTEKGAKAKTIEWFISVDGAEPAPIEGETSKTLKHVFETKTDSLYTISASVNGVGSSNSVKIKSGYAELKQISVTSASDEIIYGRIQRNRLTEDAAREAVISVGWEEKYLDPLVRGEYNVDFYLDSNLLSSGLNKTFSFTPATDNVQERIIKIVVTLGGKTVEEQITFAVIESYRPIEEVKVSAAPADINGGDYAVYYSGADIPSVRLSAAAEPLDGTDLKSKAVWMVRNSGGVYVSEPTDREYVFTPAYGKNVVTATIDNLPSSEFVVYALTESEYNKTKYAINNSFVWNGSRKDCYVLDQSDMNSVLSYMISRHKTGYEESGLKLWFQNAEWRTGDGVLKGVLETAMRSSDESGLFRANFIDNVLFLNESCVFGEAELKYDQSRAVHQIEGLTHYSANGGSRALYIDSAERSTLVENSNQLFRAVGWGYKPLFGSDAEGRALKSIYDEARRVLCDIIDDGMNEYQKVRAIYEWIVTEVDYDYDAAEDTAPAGATQEEAEAKLAQQIRYNAYYLEGVFNDRQAVCDGKSKAFVLLCGMEGIRSVRVTGTALSGPGTTAGHAWNKVLIDIDGDGKREWYVIDTTWGDAALGTTLAGLGGIKEIGVKTYFLVTDEFISGTHFPTGVNYPQAVDQFDYYASAYENLNGREVLLRVTDKNGLETLMDLLNAERIKRGAVYFGTDLEIDIAGYGELSSVTSLISRLNAASDYAVNVYALDETLGRYYLLFSN